MKRFVRVSIHTHPVKKVNLQGWLNNVQCGRVLGTLATLENIHWQPTYVPSRPNELGDFPINFYMMRHCIYRNFPRNSKYRQKKLKVILKPMKY